MCVVIPVQNSIGNCKNTFSVSFIQSKNFCSVKCCWLYFMFKTKFGRRKERPICFCKFMHRLLVLISSSLLFFGCVLCSYLLIAFYPLIRLILFFDQKTLIRCQKQYHLVFDFWLRKRKQFPILRHKSSDCFCLHHYCMCSDCKIKALHSAETSSKLFGTSAYQIEGAINGFTRYQKKSAHW